MKSQKNETNNPGTEESGKSIEEAGSFDDIIKSGSVFVGNEYESFYCLTIIGQVEGHFVLDSNQKTTKYDHLIPLLVALEESDRIDGILIILNTMGGDVEAGLALAELIASMKKPTVTLVLGGGHSIGVPLAVAGKVSMIIPSATMTVHPVRTTGMVIGVPQSFDYLQKMQDRIVRFIVEHSHVKEGYLRRMLTRTDQMANDIGSVIDGDEAVRCGLIDRIGGLSDALSCLLSLRDAAKNEKNELQNAETDTCEKEKNVVK